MPVERREKPPQSKKSKEYNWPGGVDPVIANAVSSGKWEDAIQWKLLAALKVFRAHTPQLDYMRISQNGMSFKGWLETASTLADIPAWNETAMSISVYARYEQMLRYKAECDERDRKNISESFVFSVTR